MLFFLITLFKLLTRFVYVFIKLLPVRNRISFISRQFTNENPDFVTLEEELGLMEKFKEWEFKYSYKVVYDTPYSILMYIPTMLKQMILISTSRLVILDGFCIPVSILKHKKSLKVLQIWHGVGLMKKAGFASLDTNNGRNSSVASLLNMHRGYTHILANSWEAASSLFEVFGYSISKDTHLMEGKNSSFVEEPILGKSMSQSQECPLREDVTDSVPLEKSGFKDSVNGVAFPVIARPPRFLSTFPIVSKEASTGAKTVLYSPTIKVNHRLLEEKIFELNRACLSSGYKLIVRPHPHNGIKFSDKLRNTVKVVEKGLSLELAKKCDFVVVDYSSLIFELIYEGVPVAFFPYDFDEYETNDLLFINYKNEIPGVIATTGEDVVLSFPKIDVQKQKDFFLKYVDLGSEGLSKQIAMFA